jgi:ornithine carbamoyltransferase
VSLAYPEKYDLLPDVIERARAGASRHGGSFAVTHSMEEAFTGADIVYPKSWAPFHVMEQRTALLKKSDRQGLADLEKQCLLENAKHTAWECDQSKMQLTAGGKALYMHCLPADISGVSCAQGEVASDVFERYRIPTYRQAGFKPFVISALMFLTRVPQPAETLSHLISRGLRRTI